ncbi:MAG: DUF6265 family protein [Cognaticolwellia sp.]
MKILLLTISLLASTSASANNCNSLNDLTWLLGKWQTQHQQPSTTEHWAKLSDKTFEGYGKTASHYESLRLVEMSGAVFYLAKVSHNPSPVAFKLTHCSNGHFSFENTQHDFPNKIDYHQTGDDAIQVTVSGQSGKSFAISLHRVKDTNTQEK